MGVLAARVAVIIISVAAPVAVRADAPGQTAPEVRTCQSWAPGRPTGEALRAAYDASVSGGADRGGWRGDAALTVALGATLWSDVQGCARAQELELDVSATPRWSSTAGGAAIDTTATLRYDPTAHADPDLGVLAWALTSWELGYRGAVHAQPQLADRADLARDLFDRFTVTGATRMFRVAIADVCRPGDQRQECREQRGPTTPMPMTIDLGVFEGATGFTEQGARRDEGTGAVALMRVGMREINRTAVDGEVDLLRVERARVAVGDVTGTIDVVWPVRIRTSNPRTGTEYVIGWGKVAAFALDDGTREPVREHRPVEDRSVGGIGFTTGGLARGTGAGWQRTAYVTMAAEPVLEDRITGEAWGTIDGVAARARVFAARLERLSPAEGQAAVTWTGGVELGGSYRVRSIDIDVTTELGRSYYATLDGGAATAGFGARALLTLHHAGDAAWSR